MFAGKNDSGVAGAFSLPGRLSVTAALLAGGLLNLFVNARKLVERVLFFFRFTASGKCHWIFLKLKHILSDGYNSFWWMSDVSSLKIQDGLSVNVQRRRNVRTPSLDSFEMDSPCRTFWTVHLGPHSQGANRGLAECLQIQDHDMANGPTKEDAPLKCFDRCTHRAFKALVVGLLAWTLVSHLYATLKITVRMFSDAQFPEGFTK